LEPALYTARRFVTGSRGPHHSADLMASAYTLEAGAGPLR
jgi:hypothetical protein